MKDEQPKNPVGRPPKFKTPEELQEKAEEYFAFCDDEKNWVKAYSKKGIAAKQNHGGNEAKSGEDTLLIPRPYTLDGLSLWLGVADWAALKKSDCYQTEDFLGVIRALEARVRDKQVVGALCQVYSPNLTARLNGLADIHKQELDEKNVQTAAQVIAAILGIPEDEIQNR